LTVAINVITNTKLADVPTNTFKGRITAASGDPEDLTVTQATSMLNVFTGDSGSGGVKGLVPAPAAGDTASAKFLSASGGWGIPAGSGGVSDGDKGDIVVSGSGSVWSIDTAVVTNTKLATVPTSTFKGRITAATGTPEDLTVTQATSLLNVFAGDSGSGGLKGLVPGPAAG